MRSVQLKNGAMIPKLGMGTWYMGEDPHKAKNEIESLRLGVELGVMPDTGDLLRGYLAQYGHHFDFVLGSTHLVDKKDPYQALLTSSYAMELKRIDSWINISTYTGALYWTGLQRGVLISKLPLNNTQRENWLP